jgi:hypothetical protein
MYKSHVTNLSFKYRRTPLIQMGLRRQERILESDLHAQSIDQQLEGERVLLQDEPNRPREYL